MAHVERTLTTTTDIHTVWDYLTDFRTTEEWAYRAEFRTHGAAKLAEPLLPPGLKILGDKVAASMQERLDALGAAATAADGSGVQS